MEGVRAASPGPFLHPNAVPARSGGQSRRPMIAFVVRRLLQSILVLLAVGFIAYSLFTYAGDPITNMLHQDTTLEHRHELPPRLRLEEPFLLQSGLILATPTHAHFATSYPHPRPVAAPP